MKEERMEIITIDESAELAMKEISKLMGKKVVPQGVFDFGIIVMMSMFMNDELAKAIDNATKWMEQNE